jgi:hypothetical protein
VAALEHVQSLEQKFDASEAMLDEGCAELMAKFLRENRL